MSNDLYHHGILGMKWGVRRYQNSDGSLTSEGKKRLKKEEPNSQKNGNKSSSKKYSKKEVKNFTDEELSANIKRLEQEARYIDLNQKVNKGTSSKGKEFVEKYLQDAGKKIIWDTTVDVASQAVKHLITKKVNKALNEKDEDGNLKDVVFANNKKKN